MSSSELTKTWAERLTPRKLMEFILTIPPYYRTANVRIKCNKKDEMPNILSFKQEKEWHLDYTDGRFEFNHQSHVLTDQSEWDEIIYLNDLLRNLQTIQEPHLDLEILVISSLRLVLKPKARNTFSIDDILEPVVELNPETELIKALTSAFRTYEDRIGNAQINCTIELSEPLKDGGIKTLELRWVKSERQILESKHDVEYQSSVFAHPMFRGFRNA